MREMEPQRRKKSVGGERQLRSRGGLRRQIGGFGADARRQIVPESGVQVAFGRTEKDARSPLTAARAVIRARVGGRPVAAIGVMAGVSAGRFDGRHRLSIPPTGVGMMPATAKHHVYGQQSGRQV
jgi:hypothetical protein